jgi:lysophospholipase L1-like esterase
MSQPWINLGVWGDSIVHGGLDEEAGGWVMRLKLYLMRRGLGDHVFNLGLGGNTSGGVAANIATELAHRSTQIEHVLVGVGTNDFLGLHPETTLAEFQANLEAIVKIAHDDNKAVHLLTMTRNLMNPERQATFNAVIMEVAKKEQCRLIDLRHVPDKENLPDGIHPNAPGHEKVFHAVKAALIKQGVIPPEPAKLEQTDPASSHSQL